MCELWLFLAFGTRGDVQPVAVVAEESRRRTAGRVQPVLLTHSAHRVWLSREPFGELRVREVETSPYGRAPAPDTCGQTAGEGKVEAADEECYQQRACWEAANQLNNTISPTDSCKAGISLIVFNLFALEAFHIAEALQTPCMAVASYPVPTSSCPPGFKRRFAAAFGQRLLNRLADANGSGSISWAEISLWMWPLFTERWHWMRTDVLGLAESPLHDKVTLQEVEKLPKAVPLVYAACAAFRMLVRSAVDPDLSRADGVRCNDSGYSDLIVPRPGHFPSSIHVTSFWLPRSSWLSTEYKLPESAVGAQRCAENHDVRGVQEDDTCSPAAVMQKPACGGHAQEHLHQTHRTTDAPLCVDISSSGHLGLIPDPDAFVSVLLCALDVLERHAILLTSGWLPIHNSMRKLRPNGSNRLALIEEPVLHQQLLPQCSMLMHPGGSGTTAACLMTGIPQLLFPLHFDQHFWADRLEFLGLSPQPLKFKDVFVDMQSRAMISSELQDGSHASSAPNHSLGCNLDATHGRNTHMLVQRLREGLSQGIQAACRKMALDISRSDGLTAVGDIALRESESKEK